MVGWLLWAVLTWLALAAGYAVSASLFPERGLPHRLAVALLVQLGLILASIQLLGALGLLTAAPLALASLLASGVALGLSVRKIGLGALRARIRDDLAAPRGWIRAWRTPELAWLVALIPAGIALGGVLAQVWYFKTWAWDAAWYHQPMIGYTIQNHGFRWIDTPITWISGYPRNVELVALWSCIFQHSNRLDDSGQLPFLALGMLLTVAWARRMGASRPLAAGLGASLVALPPILVQASSSEVDIACGVLLAAAVYFLSEASRPADRWLALVAVGIYVGSKYTGAFHALLLAPWFAVVAGLELWRARGQRLRRAGDIVASVLVALALGIFKYVQNGLHTGNPIWPLRTHLPILGTLPGPEDPATMAYYGLNSYFFSNPGDFTRFVQSVLDDHPNYEPNVHSGGFGPLTPWMIAPCLVGLAIDAIRGRNLRFALGPVVLAGLAIVVPGAWWPRYTIGAAVAGLVAIGAVVSSIPWWPLRAALALPFAFLLNIPVADAHATPHAFPRKLEQARHMSWPALAALQIDPLNWPTGGALQYQAELRPGDVVAYDDGVYFLSELFAPDFGTVVKWVPLQGDPGSYPGRLRAAGARWAVVESRSAQALELQRAGFTFLFSSDNVSAYRVPR